MHIYLVMLGDGDYEAEWVDSAWTTRELADARIARWNGERSLRGTPASRVQALTLDPRAPDKRP